ncbi:hypothetical protein FBUS_07822 [Fasciolopsis buskii]|uniref:Uncharacterized protein n=1 Tax=Fasciolopsis buskii TaxID=27845 RepID=A0A8E0S1Y4_9TREM|nr:hypothetical protein FBUS_07822 [Fasciolopsis buski]
MKLLQKDPRRRIGGTSMLSRLKFFSGLIDFYKVELRQYDPRAFYKSIDVVKLPEGPLKRWIADYSGAPNQWEQFHVRSQKSEVGISHSPTAQKMVAVTADKKLNQRELHHISEWLLVQPEVTGTSELPNFIQLSELRSSTRSSCATRTSKNSFTQSSSIIHRGTSYSSIKSNVRSEHEKNGLARRFWHRNTRRPASSANENELNIVSDSCQDNNSVTGHRRGSIKSLWASFKERVSRVTHRNNTTRSKSLAPNEKKRQNKVEVESETNSDRVKMYVNVIRSTPSPTQQHSIKSTPDRGGSKENRDYEASEQFERIIYIKPRQLRENNYYGF